ncbi:MAG: hypothetical protein ACREPG_06530, partial [Candidatus Binatia bacterium]
PNRLAATGTIFIGAYRQSAISAPIPVRTSFKTFNQFKSLKPFSLPIERIERLEPFERFERV